MRILQLLILLAAGSVVRAGSVYVTTDTSLLIGDPAGPFSIGFELADGSGIGDGNNAVVLSNFQFGSGSPVGPPFLNGSVSGDLSSSIILTDLNNFAVFSQLFLPGNVFGFQIDYTSNVDAGTPDEFVFAILDHNDSPIPTTGGIALFQIDFDSANPTVQTFAGDPSQLMSTGASGIPIPDPVLSPEPSTLGLVSLALAGWAIRKRRSLQ